MTPGTTASYQNGSTTTTTINAGHSDCDYVDATRIEQQICGSREDLPHDDEEDDDGREDEEEFFWHFTDFGVERERSRDGSIHATDEVFNSISHLAAFFISVLGSVLLISDSSSQGAPWKIVSFSIYGMSLCLLFGASTIHHAVTTTRQWEFIFQLLDYLAIFPLIAGTFTPLCLVYLHSTTMGWSFFAVVWTLSILCMYFLCREFAKIPKWMTMTMYLSLGWFGGLLCLYLYPRYMPFGGIVCMIVGGLFYSIGGYIYTTEQPNPVPGRFGFHELWHIFVILGATTHWMMMYAYVLPYDPTSNQ